LKGLPEAINTTWEHTVVQQCIVHLIRNSFRYAGRQHRDAIVRSLKPLSHGTVRGCGEGPVRGVRHRVG
jgi:transposase-like protein